MAKDQKWRSKAEERKRRCGLVDDQSLDPAPEVDGRLGSSVLFASLTFVGVFLTYDLSGTELFAESVVGHDGCGDEREEGYETG
jgi:hypothetical protein